MYSALTVILWSLAIFIVCFTICGIIVMVDYLRIEVFEDWRERK